MTRLLLIFFFLVVKISLFAQVPTIFVSNEISISKADVYGLIGKYEDKILYYQIYLSRITLRSFDTAMRQMAERKIDLEPTGSSRLLEIIPSKTDFSVVYGYRRKGNNFLKVAKYSPLGKLIDSATVFNFGESFERYSLELSASENKKVILVCHEDTQEKTDVVAVSLDSLKMIWKSTLLTKNMSFGDNHRANLISNDAQAFFITEYSNRAKNIDAHEIQIQSVNAEGGQKLISIPAPNFSQHTLFTLDNANSTLLGVGLYGEKGNYKRTDGFFTLKILFNPLNWSINYQPFDKDLIMAATRKKGTDTFTGFNDELEVQQIALKRDGGYIMVFEQFKKVERAIASSPSNYYRGAVESFRLSTDYFYDQMICLSINPEGQKIWHSVFFKKQYSQNDDGKYSSGFLMKTPSFLRMIFNDEVKNATTVSEFLFTGIGEAERHSILNTDQRNIALRFRDALQVSATELIVPSEDSKDRLRLVRLSFNNGKVEQR